MATTVSRRTLAAAILGAVGVGAAAVAAGTCAHADPVDLRVVDRDSGRVLPLWRHDGRLYVAGRPGARYGLRVVNHTGRRVLVVMSVDGVNILSGETAGADQRGYIFGPYERYDITGWRKSDTEVAAFTFAPLSQSYAARTGRPADVGVIGIAVFNERRRPPPPPPPPVDDEAAISARRAPFAAKAPPPAQPAPAPPPSAAGSRAAPMARAAPGGEVYDEPRDERLGTGHGAREWSVTHTEPFECETAWPQFTRQIEYDTYANLAARGVIPRHAEPPRHPRPFPQDPDDGGYVPDPPDEP
ncbi:hypothetical protein ACO2Q3_02935 [Caulobacter sp. KR2-114]|uniref:hypothetical protein n=1 Tax=Caulobacter sp. KR2-114 TaxID=3400912 RepID=UPI003C106339